jgi:hypothetical protein
MKRIAGLGIWPIAFIFVCFDSPVLGTFDFVLLMVLTSLGSWAILTRLKLVRYCIATFLLLLIVVAMYYEPILRSVISHPEMFDKGFNGGASAFFQSIRPYRPYIIIAAFTLCGMGFSNVFASGAVEKLVTDCSQKELLKKN